MTGKTDVVKGRIKEAVGALTGSEKLRAEGQADQMVGEIKQTTDKVVEAAQATVVKAQEVAKDALAKAKDAVKQMHSWEGHLGPRETADSKGLATELAVYANELVKE